MNLPWTEKYRPKTLEDVLSHKPLIDTLKKNIKNNNLQHLLFHGPSGIGKTSTIIACANELYGDMVDFMTLNINSSEERGIGIVRKNVLDFVNRKNIYGKQDKSLYKLVILDEADAMTLDAQAILRQVIEKYSYCARFCLICNNINKIILALQSRCICYRFSHLSKKDITGKIKNIAENENIIVTDDGINTIINRSRGDMRKILNILQTTSMTNDIINDDAVNRSINYPTSDIMQKIIRALMNDDIKTAYGIISEIQKAYMLSLNDIITEIGDMMINYCAGENVAILSDLKSYDVLGMLKGMSDIENNLSVGTDETIQLSTFIGLFAFNKHKKHKN